jgi:hypothetical protein
VRSRTLLVAADEPAKVESSRVIVEAAVRQETPAR